MAKGAGGGGRTGRTSGGMWTGFRSLGNVGFMPGQSVIGRTSRSVTVRTDRGFGSYDIDKYILYDDGIYVKHVRRHIPG